MISEIYLIILAEAAVIIWTAVAVKKKIPYDRIIITAVFIFYMAALIAAVFFPIKFDQSRIKSYDDMEHRLQLIPFNTTIEFIKSSSAFNAFVQIVGNIVMTVPFGFLLPLLHKFRKKYMYVLTALLFPLCIEVTQLIIGLSLGTLYRTADVDDIIYNFSGIMAGYALYKLMQKALKAKSKKTVNII